jgi:hypothetical protein
VIKSKSQLLECITSEIDELVIIETEITPEKFRNSSFQVYRNFMYCRSFYYRFRNEKEQLVNIEIPPNALFK